MAAKTLLIQFSPSVSPDIPQMLHLPRHKEQEHQFEVVLWVAGLLGLFVQFENPNKIKQNVS